MKPRMEFWKVAPDAYKAMSSLDAYLRESGLDKGLFHMVKLRASQINGCGYCIDMHWKDARAAGESEQRLYGLRAWREAPYYTPRERAALALTEAVTLIADGVAHDVYADAERHFQPAELAALIWSIAVINTWNR